MKKIIFLFFTILLSLFFSCSTDFDVNAEWKDITVVYCLLNQNDSAHYVKVNKAFLGEQDAYIMAQISDSFNYENINVSLEQWNNDNRIKIIPLEKTTEIVKQPGIFATDNNIIYKTTGSIFADSEYKLIIDIPGKEPVTSTTKLIARFNVLNNFGAFKTPIEDSIYYIDINFIGSQ